MTKLIGVVMMEIPEGQRVEQSHDLRKQELALQPLQVLVADGGRDWK